MSISERPSVHANRQLMGQALTNLIDNALKYGASPTAPTGTDATRGRISLTVEAIGDSARVTVGDHGQGIAASDRERALKRFIRLEQSRTKPGTGLGLSLVAAVARIYGGHLTLADNAPGLKVILEMRRQTPRTPYF
ncbi:MAG: sensor histidine kinase [Hyphomicrobiaceae bacterium]